MHATNVRASVYMMLSMAGFTLNDALIKSIDGALSLAQILVVRGGVATLLLLILHWLISGGLRPGARDVSRDTGSKFPVASKRSATSSRWAGTFHPLLLWRGVFDIAATMAFLTALTRLPLADITAIMQALPLAVTLGAVFVFAEVVGWRRWVAILIGFVGVLIIVRPGMTGFSSYSLLALLAVGCAAARDLVTRRIPAQIPSLLVSIVTAALVTLSGVLLMMVRGGWQPMDVSLWLKLLMAAGFIMAGYHFVILAMRSGEISFVAPFRYTGLVWAMVLGFFWFGERPGWHMIVGATLIVGTGLYAFRRERQLAKNAN